MTTFQDLRNATDIEFIDISSEEYREYDFGYRIEAPVALGISESGTHRILAANGESLHIDPVKGVAIKWLAKDGAPHFVA